VPVPVHPERVDCLHDLVEDIEAVLFGEGLIPDELGEVAVVGFCDVPDHFFIGDLGEYLEEVFFEGVVVEVFEDFGVELEALVEPAFFREVDVDELREEAPPVALLSLHHLGGLAAELFHLLA
jgi:hypothetical protein